MLALLASQRRLPRLVWIGGDWFGWVWNELFEVDLGDSDLYTRNTSESEI